MRERARRWVMGMAVVGALFAAAPARAELLGFQLHLNGGFTSITTGTGGGWHTDRNPVGIDVGLSTGIVPFLRLEVFADAMSDFQHDGFFSLGGRVLFELSDHFDLGAAANVGYSVDFDTSSTQLGWMAGPHLQFHFLLLNIYFQPTYARDVLGQTEVIYPLYGGVGLQF